MTEFKEIKNVKGYIHSIETLAALDGPGIRTAVFFSGCPQRCLYCHNPDMFDMTDGKLIESTEIFAKIKRNIPYFGKRGGVTLTGGEPFMQARFAYALINMCREENINVAVDTCGFYFNDDVVCCTKAADLIILDIKHTDPKAFFDLTGADLSRTLIYLDYLKKIQKPVWIRQVIVPGINDSMEQIEVLASLIKDVNILKVHLLPYHTMGIIKWQQLGFIYKLTGVPEASKEHVNLLQKYLDELINQ